MRVWGVKLAAAVMLSASPCWAHHSFSSEYSITSQVAIKGELISVEWRNPHVFLVIAVRSDDGKMQDWRIEGGAIRFLKQSGWTPGMLRQMAMSRAMVGVTGYSARRQSESGRGAWAKEIELPDGQKLPFN
jgi:hypothetical protein